MQSTAVNNCVSCGGWRPAPTAPLGTRSCCRGAPVQGPSAAAPAPAPCPAAEPLNKTAIKQLMRQHAHAACGTYLRYHLRPRYQARARSRLAAAGLQAAGGPGCWRRGPPPAGPSEPTSIASAYRSTPRLLSLRRAQNPPRIPASGDPHKLIWKLWHYPVGPADGETEVRF